MSNESEAGKGDRQRTRQVSYEQYARNWDNIFNTPMIGYSDNAGEMPPELEEITKRNSESIERLLDTLKDENGNYKDIVFGPADEITDAEFEDLIPMSG